MEGIPTTSAPDPFDPRPLDEVLASRSHVRVLRALIKKDPQENVGVRDVARLAGVSHPRTAQVLAALSESGLILQRATRWGPLYDLNHEHFLAPQLWTLFDDELHVLPAIQGYARAEARKMRRPIRFRLETGVGCALELLATGPSPFGWEDRHWFGELEAGIEQHFGLDVRVAPEDPNEWLVSID